MKLCIYNHSHVTIDRLQPFQIFCHDSKVTIIYFLVTSNKINKRKIISSMKVLTYRKLFRKVLSVNKIIKWITQVWPISKGQQMIPERVSPILVQSAIKITYIQLRSTKFSHPTLRNKRPSCHWAGMNYPLSGNN